MKKFAFLLILIAIAAGVAQQPQNNVATNEEESECWECHQPGGTGGGRTFLVKMFTVKVEEGLQVRTQEAFDFNVSIENTWWAEEYDMHATLDLTRVPSLSFAANNPPQSDQAAANIPPASLNDRESKQTDTSFSIPVGATEFKYKLTQTEGNAPLEATIWGPRDDQREPGEAITLPYELTLRGSSTIAAAAGEYRIQIIRPGILDVAPNLADMDAVQEEQSFRSQWGSWFNVTDETSQVITTDVRLDPETMGEKPSTTLSWQLYAQELPREGQSVDVHVSLTAHYDHASSQSGFDTWRFEREIKFPFTFPKEETNGTENVFVIGNSQDEAEPETIVANTATPLARYGEILGYTASFLVISSLVTGGIMGRPMKWWCNLFFRRARNRITYHNFTSNVLLWVAIAHLALFLYEVQYHWSIGLLFGGSSILLLLILALTGIFQVPMIRGTNYGFWKTIHYGTAFLLIFTISAHILLDGIHFESVQQIAEEQYGWKDPLRDMFGPQETAQDSMSLQADS